MIIDSRPQALAKIIQEHYQPPEFSDVSERWLRLSSEPLMIFCDLFRLFRWTPILDELSHELYEAVGFLYLRST